MNKEQIQEAFRIFMRGSGGVWDADNEIDYVKNLAYRDGAIDFCTRLLEELEKSND